MQLPYGWDVQVVPGVLYLLALFLLIRRADRDLIIRYIKDYAIITVPLIVVLAYIVATSADALLTHPIHYVYAGIYRSLYHMSPPAGPTPCESVLAAKYADPKLLQEEGNEYRAMLFYRSLFFSFMAIVVPSTLILRRSQLKKRMKIFLVIVMVATACGLYFPWMEKRGYYFQFSKEANTSARLNSQQEVGAP
jgi:hypothetical protein